jgi:hypothetical protein
VISAAITAILVVIAGGAAAVLPSASAINGDADVSNADPCTIEKGELLDPFTGEIVYPEDEG